MGVVVCGGAKKETAPRGGRESVVSPSGIPGQTAQVHASARRSTSLAILAVRNRHESLDSSGRLSPGKACFRRRSNSLLSLACTSLCLPPPPPSPFPRTTVRFPLLSLLTGECFRGPRSPAIRIKDNSSLSAHVFNNKVQNRLILYLQGQKRN